MTTKNLIKSVWNENLRYLCFDILGKGRNKSSEMYSLYIDTNSLVKASTLAIEEADSGTSNTEGFTKDYVHFSTKELLGIRAIKE